MIRTKVHKLEAANGYTYRQKLSDGSINIVLLAPKTKIVAVLDGKTNKCTKYGKLPTIFKPEMFAEAVELTSDEPYIFAGPVKVYANGRLKEEEPEKDGELDKVCELEEYIIKSSEYQAIIDTYSDTNDKFACARFNKALIQFAASSSAVRKMLAERASQKSIITYIVRTKSSKLSGNFLCLSDEEVQTLIDVLDNMTVRSAFKEVRKYLKGRASKVKRI